MFFNRYFAPSFALIVLIALLHYLALDRAYYWTIAWYDIMMHFLGGLWVALATIWILRTERLSFFKKCSWKSVLVAVLVIGVLWEVYEVVFGLTFISDPEYWGDTTLDLIMDLVGGALGIGVSRDIRHG